MVVAELSLFWEYFSHSRVLNQIELGVGDELLRVGQYLWHLDSDSCGRRVLLSALGSSLWPDGHVWPLIGQLEQYPPLIGQ